MSLQATVRITTLIVWSILLGGLAVKLCKAQGDPTLPTSDYSPELDVDQLYTKMREKYHLLNTEPVIFEPLQSIKLSRAIYKVTSYINLDPYLQSFKNYRTYMTDFQKDIKSPEKMGALMGIEYRVSINQTETDCQYWVDKSSYSTLKCRYHRQYMRIIKESDVLVEIFDAVYQRFLAAIDHLDYHPSQSFNTESEPREKRFIQEDQQMPHRQYEGLNSAGSEFLDYILAEIKRLRPEVHKELSREKRFNLMTWIIGWGTWSNAGNIKKMKKKYQNLQTQNFLQEAQILELTHYMTLTMNQVREHRNAMYDLDNRLLLVNKTLMTHVTAYEYSMAYHETVATEARIVLARLTNGLIGLRENVDKIYEYLRVMASHHVNPMILPPESLRSVLKSIQNEMKQNPRLELPYHPDGHMVLLQYHEGESNNYG